MDVAGGGLPFGRSPFRFNSRLLAAGAALIVVAFGVLALFDRALGGILFLAGLSLALDGINQFHPLFVLLLPLLALIGAVTDASRGLPGAALLWFVGAALIFALGRVLRYYSVPHVRPNPALESLTVELAALKAKRDRGEITDEEFRTRRDAAIAAFQQASPDALAPPDPSKAP